MRVFDTGATRDSAEGKPDYISYLSPLVLRRYGEYMLAHEMQPDGTRRAPDNWKRGIPTEEYLRSCFRHLLDWWLEMEGEDGRDGLEDALCAIIFNASGALHEVLKRKKRDGDA